MNLFYANAYFYKKIIRTSRVTTTSRVINVHIKNLFSDDEKKKIFLLFYYIFNFQNLKPSIILNSSLPHVV
jgi:hypothetical protein